MMLLASPEYKQFVRTQQEAPRWHDTYQTAWQELQPMLEQGVVFLSKRKIFRVRLLHENNSDEINQIVRAANTLPQLVGLDPEGVRAIAREKLALVTEARVGNKWEVSSYMGAEPLTPDEKRRRLSRTRQGRSIRELRTSITFTNNMSQSGIDYRGYGLNTKTKPIQFLSIFALSDGTGPLHSRFDKTPLT